MSNSDESDPKTPKPVLWVGSSRKDLRKFPARVRSTFGQALFDAQMGGKHPDAKPLKGFGGASVLEVIENEQGSTYRAVYTVKLAGIVYVLHAFQKKAKKGIQTPAEELEKVRARLKDAEEDYAERLQQQEESEESRP